MCKPAKFKLNGSIGSLQMRRIGSVLGLSPVYIKRYSHHTVLTWLEGMFIHLIRLSVCFYYIVGHGIRHLCWFISSWCHILSPISQPGYNPWFIECNPLLYLQFKIIGLGSKMPIKNYLCKLVTLLRKEEDDIYNLILLDYQCIA